MAEGIVPVEWVGRRAVVVLPVHLEGPGAVRAGEQLLGVIAGGARVVVADLSATVSFDHAGVDALNRAYLRASIAQAELRLATGTAAAGELVSSAGLDRLVATFPRVSMALAAPERDGHHWWPAAGPQGQEPGPGPVDGGAAGGGVSAVVLRQVIDALDDGIVLADEDGVIVLASRRLASMFGYGRGELAGRPVECLVPAGLREAHRRQRAAYQRDPAPRPMGHRERLAGIGKDGSSVPVTISLRPVPTAGGRLVLGVVRDATRSPRGEDLASMAWAAAAEQDQRSQELLGRVATSLFGVGQSLEAAAGLPAARARERLADALERLDEVIHDIRDHVFRPPGSGHHRQ